jgi:peptide deformylase
MGAAAVDDLVEVEHAKLQSDVRLGVEPEHRLVKPGAVTYLAAMTIRPILIHPDPRLRKEAEPVGTIDDEIRKLAADMLETMYDAPGIGLAAPQVGVLRRVFVMDCGAKEGEPDPLVMVNPEILHLSDETAPSEEGCLSIPEIYADVTRPVEVTLRWTDLEGATRENRFDARPATCVQHEMDHLAGKLFIDYLSAVKRTMITSKMRKLKKEMARA